MAYRVKSRGTLVKTWFVKVFLFVHVFGQTEQFGSDRELGVLGVFQTDGKSHFVFFHFKIEDSP